MMTLYFINIVLYFITFNWVIMLDKTKCECSKNWKRDFIKYFLLTMIIYLICSFIYITLSKVYNLPFFNVFEIISKIFYILEIFYIIVVFIYIKDLKKRCKCSQSVERDITEIYSTIDVILFIITIFLFFCLLIYKSFMNISKGLINSR